MKIYVNDQQRICAVHSTTNQDLTELEIPDTTFANGTTNDLITCYSCCIDNHGHYTVQLLIPPDMAEQINQFGLQRIADQNLMESQLETIVETDHRLSILELGL